MSMFKGKNIAILGLSIEGLDSVRFFCDQGANITCCDRRSKEELTDALKILKKYPVSYQLGNDYLRNLNSYDAVVRTPGMSPRLPELIELRDAGKEITSLTKLFFELCKAPIIGVTGTKGKGTTATLIAEMLRESGEHVHLGGNVGTPLLSKIKDITEDDWVVLELSSFQLEDLSKSPHIAVVLRTTQEHLANFDTLATNFHPSKDAYIEAKKSIVRYQNSNDHAILNADDPTSRSFALETRAKIYLFSRLRRDTTAYVSHDAVYLQIGKKVKICDFQSIKLIGRHNLDNIAAATLAATIVGVIPASITRTVNQFKGLEHRLELTRTLHNVLYVNDSFSTVPETTIAAIESFSQPIILIVGGSEKGSDFTELGNKLPQSTVKMLIVVGAMTDRIVHAALQSGFNKDIITGCTSMQKIVQVAHKNAKPGDVVLLSPACASFDMFKNYKERGKQFKHEVGLL